MAYIRNIAGNRRLDPKFGLPAGFYRGLAVVISWTVFGYLFAAIIGITGRVL